MAIKKVRIRPEGGNNYADVLHPETSADVVIENENKMFVSNAEKAKWNNKADKTYVDTELNKRYLKEQVFTKEEVLQKIQDVIGAAPEALDTLQEIAKALNNDANFAGTITNELSKKVDKITGKQLSTEDYTTVEKNKLAGIEEGANKYIHPSTHPASMIVESTSRRFVSDAEKSKWNNKAEISDIPTKVGQLENDKNYVTQEELESATHGSMVKSVYDKNDDGIVDVAETVIGNEIQLGSYKLVYNSTTNSLDIEVVA